MMMQIVMTWGGSWGLVFTEAWPESHTVTPLCIVMHLQLGTAGYFCKHKQTDTFLAYLCGRMHTCTYILTLITYFRYIKIIFHLYTYPCRGGMLLGEWTRKTTLVYVQWVSVWLWGCFVGCTVLAGMYESSNAYFCAVSVFGSKVEVFINWVNSGFLSIATWLAVSHLRRC